VSSVDFVGENGVLKSSQVQNARSLIMRLPVVYFRVIDLCYFLRSSSAICMYSAWCVLKRRRGFNELALFAGGEWKCILIGEEERISL
jgi:hypothetical protein